MYVNNYVLKKIKISPKYTLIIFMSNVLTYSNVKQVRFSETSIKYITYGSDEYDRHPIESTLYLRSYQRISDNEWKDIMEELNNYKMTEMIVHKDNVNRIHLH